MAIGAAPDLDHCASPVRPVRSCALSGVQSWPDRTTGRIATRRRDLTQALHVE